MNVFYSVIARSPSTEGRRGNPGDGENKILTRGIYPELYEILRPDCIGAQNDTG